MKNMMNLIILLISCFAVSGCYFQADHSVHQNMKSYYPHRFFDKGVVAFKEDNAEVYLFVNSSDTGATVTKLNAWTPKTAIEGITIKFLVKSDAMDGKGYFAVEPLSAGGYNYYPIGYHSTPSGHRYFSWYELENEIEVSSESELVMQFKAMMANKKTYNRHVYRVIMDPKEITKAFEVYNQNLKLLGLSKQEKIKREAERKKQAAAREARLLPEKLHQKGHSAYRKEDYKAAFDYWLQAEKLGSFSSSFDLGYMLYKGIGVKKSLLTAFIKFQKAAKAGHPHAQYYVATMYKNGEVVRTNLEKARLWYEKAAAQNHAGSLLMLAIMYIEGKGGPQNKDKGMDLLKKSCRLGNETACNASK